jgi:hypothetical protein
MRQMPAGQWVAFEGDGVHDCGRPPPQRVTTSPPQRGARTPAASGEFEDFEILSGASAALSIPKPIQDRAPAPQTQPTLVIRNVSAKPAPSTTGQEEFEDFEIPATAASSNINARSPSPAHKNTRATSHLSGRPAQAIRPNQPRAQAGRQASSFKTALYAFVAIYIFIGAFHSAFFSLYISRAHCLSPKNMIVYVFCNTGMGISHLVAVLGWPLYYR